MCGVMEMVLILRSVTVLQRIQVKGQNAHLPCVAEDRTFCDRLPWERTKITSERRVVCSRFANLAWGADREGVLRIRPSRACIATIGEREAATVGW